MMSKKSPQLRFEGFTDDWEQRKLSEGMTEYTDRVFIQDDEIYKQVSVKNIGEIILRGEQIGSKIGRKRQAKVNLKDHPNTLIFTRQTVEQGGIGFAPKETEGAIVTENMPTIDVNENIIDCNYLLAYVKTPNWYRNVILKNIEGGTAQVAIHEDSILSSEVCMPKINEQQKIGSFFKQLDNTITLHQRKLDLLKEQKKGYLQKMFPKSGAKVPELRFEGFADDWEERKLGEHAKYRRGSFPQPYGNKEWYDGEGAMPFVQVVDVTNKLTLVENTKQKISKLAQSKSVFVPKGTVVVTLQGSIGRVAITQYDSFVDRTLLIFEDYEKETDEWFWAYTIQKKFEIEKLKAPGGTIKTITKEALSSFDVHLPQFKEQAKIGSFFKQLDDTIALHQRKLDLLKEQKKGFLQKMFF